MTEQALPLITFYKGWDNYQQRLIAIIAPLSPKQLAFPAAPHHWSIGRIAQHLVADRVWWFQGWMGQGNPDLAPIMHWDEDGQPVRESAELVAGLETTWQMIQEALTDTKPYEAGQGWAVLVTEKRAILVVSSLSKYGISFPVLQRATRRDR